MSDPFDFAPEPDRYAVIGNPVGHSQSPFIHGCFADQTGQHMVYTAMCVDLGGFVQAMGNFSATGGKGLNVTVPFKMDAFQAVDEMSPRATLAGAVNTIICRDDGSCCGDNTDGAGLVRDLSVNLGLNLGGAGILLIGAGGAARGVIGPLLDFGIGRLVIANRSVEKAERLVGMFSGNAVKTQAALGACGLDQIPGAPYDLIINATAASLTGSALNLPRDIISGDSVVYDMMYASRPTPFMAWAEGLGAAGCHDGLGMLVEQAAVSFEIWRGLKPDTVPVITRVRKRLADSS